jgi:alpha-beta hydrolase superfamily lysophospholipase
MGKYIHDEGSFEGIGGNKIFFRFYKPKKYSAVVLYVHGFGEHSGRYLHPIEYLIDKGIAFYGLDLRGHGRSEGKRGHVESFDDYVRDFGTFVNIIKKREGGKKFFFLGHSMGGLVVLRYIEQVKTGYDGIITIAPVHKGDDELSKFTVFMSKHFPRFTMTNEIDPFYLSRDRDVVKRFMQDRLVHNRVSARWLTELLTERRAVIEGAKQINLPLLMLHAGRDLIVSPDGSREFFEVIGSQDKKIIIYEDYYHEILNEKGREKVFKDIEKWLKTRMGKKK